MYENVALFINGQWLPGSGEPLPVENPATGQIIGTVACATQADLAQALTATQAGFEVWRAVPAFQRYQTLRRAAQLLRERSAAIAELLTLEQGKPLPEAKGELAAAADIIDWFADEGRRLFGQVIPGRSQGVRQLALREPVGPVAAFSPWNFPVGQAVRKIAMALAAGCSIIIKGPEETPASCAALVRAFADAGVPAGVLNLVYGVPADISSYLVPHPIIRKVSFTGSTPVGKHLAGLAGQHMKRVTMELGGHAPAIIFDDADIELAAQRLVASKFRNAGQVCISPTRFLVQRGVYARFVSRFVELAQALTVGDGLAAQTVMGPLANARRLDALDRLVADAVQRGGRVLTGGHRLAREGYFYAPTVIEGLDTQAAAMNEEPFGPLALMVPFERFEDAVVEANRLPYGLAAFAFTASTETALNLADAIESGMLSVNHIGLAAPETPFGGVKDSGYGTEGGTEAILAYVQQKFVTIASQ